MLASRIHVLDAPVALNGTTPLTGLWGPEVNPNFPRLYASQGTVGRLSFANQLRDGYTSAVVIARVWAATACLMTSRTATDAELDQLKAVDDPKSLQVDALLESRQLLPTTWSAPMLLGPTDALAFTGDRNTVEYLIVEAITEAGLAFLQSVLLTVAAGADVSFMTITGTTTIPAWSGTLYAFVNSPTVPVITLPPVAEQGQDSRLVLVRTGGLRPLVQATGAELLNLVAGLPFELGGLEAAEVRRAGAGYTVDRPLISALVALANAAIGATVDLPQVTAGTTSVQVNYTAHGFLRLDVLAEAPLNADMLIQRTPGAGTSQAILIPRAGEILNGEVNGRVYLPEKGVLRVRRQMVGWCVTSDGGTRPSQKLVHGANTTVPLWGAGLICVDCTQAGAQIEALPISTDPICPGAQALFACLGAGGLTISGNGYNIRPGGGVAPAGTLVIPQYTNALLTFTGGEWTAIVT